MRAQRLDTNRRCKLRVPHDPGDGCSARWACAPIMLARRRPLDEARVAKVMSACTSDYGIVQLICADGACKCSWTALAAAADADDAAPWRCVELKAALVHIDQVLVQQAGLSTASRGR